jgi:membrane protein DedA with SNARE-associated domain
MDIKQFLIQHGLLSVLVVSMIEADLVMILAGVVAHLGFFDFGSAVLVGTIGNLAGDTIWYGLGRWHAGWLKRTGVYRRVGPLVERLARRLGTAQLLAARAIYGIRIASMVFWGLHGLRVGRFLLIDGLGCAFWATALAALGYLLSDSAEAMLGRVRRAEHWLLGAVLVAAVLLFLISKLARRELEADTAERPGP